MWSQQGLHYRLEVHSQSSWETKGLQFLSSLFPGALHNLTPPGSVPAPLLQSLLDILGCRHLSHQLPCHSVSEMPRLLVSSARGPDCSAPNATQPASPIPVGFPAPFHNCPALLAPPLPDPQAFVHAINSHCGVSSQDMARC